MRKILLIYIIFSQNFNICYAESIDNSSSIVQKACHHFYQLWTLGENNLYGTGYAWHNRYTYSPKYIRTYNELAWGGGLGKELIDNKQNRYNIYAMAFLDSHKNIEPVIGYAQLKKNLLTQSLAISLGYTALITARRDILHGIPFPGLLPLLSLDYNRLSFFATYIPGRRNNGNVLFIFGKFTLSK